jgi:signal transduction histidine kinase
MDWLLSDTPYALDNKDRIIILTVWPLVIVFVIIMIIIEFWKND